MVSPRPDDYIYLSHFHWRDAEVWDAADEINRHACRMPNGSLLHAEAC